MHKHLETVIQAARSTGISSHFMLVTNGTLVHKAKSVLLKYINSPTPLAACSNCLGTVGVMKPIAQLPRRQWRDHINMSIEESVDHDWLEWSQTNQDSRDDCKMRKITF